MWPVRARLTQGCVAMARCPQAAAQRGWARTRGQRSREHVARAELAQPVGDGKLGKLPPEAPNVPRKRGIVRDTESKAIVL